jgi:predicted MFS family arabinose efflux permease
MASAWQVFAIALVRTQFNLTADIGATIVLVGNVGLVMGMMTAGKLANIIRRKKLVVISTFCLGFLFLAFLSADSLFMATAVWLACGVIGGLSFSSDINFTLEQMPKARGTLMSVNGACIYLGFALGSAIGSFVLASYGYHIAGFTFAMFLFAASIIFLLFTKEPR